MTEKKENDKMIEIVDEIKTNKSTTNKFPKLMIHADGCIVLFESRNHGICLREGGQTQIGPFSPRSYPEDIFDAFEPYQHSLVIRNI